MAKRGGIMDIDTTFETLQKEGYLCLEILKNRKIRIDNTRFYQYRISAAAGGGEGPRNYLTTWYSEDVEGLHVCIYMSEALKGSEETILERLAVKLDSCKNEEDLINLSGDTI